MNKKFKGASLAQYGIVIALIALAIVPIYFTMGSYITKSLTDFYVSLGGNGSNQSGNTGTGTNTGATTGNASLDQSISNGTITAGQLGGTADVPVQKCAGTVCTIDYGEFVLNGIPSNFNAFVQSSGTSGGTSSLLALIDQVVSQAKNLNPPLDDIYTKNLSNQGHDLADKQKMIENTIKEMNEIYFMDKPAGQDKLNQLIMVNQQAGHAAGEFKIIHEGLLQKYPNPTQNQLNLIKTVDYLSKQIETMQSEMYPKVDDAISAYNSQLNDTTNTNSKYNIGENDVLKPMFSGDTNIKSGVICATGHGNDTGTQCN